MPKRSQDRFIVYEERHGHDATLNTLHIINGFALTLFLFSNISRKTWTTGQVNWDFLKEFKGYEILGLLAVYLKL